MPVIIVFVVLGWLVIMAILSVISMFLDIVMKLLLIALLGVVVYFVITNYKNFTKLNSKIKEVTGNE